jgi:acetyltransferase-like isoleucine patch superfamily enzyme
VIYLLLDPLGTLFRRLRRMPPRDPRQCRYLMLASLRWMVRMRAWTPFYLIRYWRLFLLRMRKPQITLQGMVFLGRRVDLHARKGYGRLVIGRWVHLGAGNAMRAHEGTFTIGEKSIFGKDNTVNCYMDVEFGPATLMADWVYLCDFDHVFSDIYVPIKDQGITKKPVRCKGDTWFATKVTVLSGTTVGWGCVVAANAVVNKDIPDFSVAVGVPARVVKDRKKAYEEDADKRAYLAGVAAKAQLAAKGVDPFAVEVAKAVEAASV